MRPDGQQQFDQLPVGLVVGAGAVAGTALRWGFIDALNSDGTLSLLSLNVAGSLLIGWLAGRRTDRSSRVWLFVATGVLGGLTSFSSFAVDVARRLDNGTYLEAAASTGATVGLTLMAAAVGFRVSTRRPAELS